MTPDAYLEVRFRTKEEGGRNNAVSGDYYACPLFVDGEGFDCRLMIAGMNLQLGSWYKVPVKFLNKDLALPKLVVGKKVTLWEGKVIADGKVIEITR
jgi:hypothetical protein